MPAVVRDLGTPERRIAWGVCADGTALVATTVALYDESSRLAWTEIERVSWEPPVLTVIEAAEVEGTGAKRSWELAEDARLAETVRACVTSSVAWSEQRRLVPAGKVRLVARRVPGEDALRWQIVWAPGTDPQDPRLRAQADELVLGLRKTIG